ncbi:MAG: hypothetical protein QOI20_3233, partial [Acidimicrobiaceae bacterium]|nr:hypothetical protein [Acidimicrobiaceae bacterium]
MTAVAAPHTADSGLAATPALDRFLGATAGMTADSRRRAFGALPEAQRATVRSEKHAIDYLRNRGFSTETIDRHGLRVERIGTRARRYGFGEQSNEAGACWGLFIPYPTFERLRLIDPADIAKFGGKYRGPAGSKQSLYDPNEWLAKSPEMVL